MDALLATIPARYKSQVTYDMAKEKPILRIDLVRDGRLVGCDMTLEEADLKLSQDEFEKRIIAPMLYAIEKEFDDGPVQHAKSSECGQEAKSA